MSRAMYGKQTLRDDDVQQALAGLRRGREALARIRMQVPDDAPLHLQTRQLMNAIDGMAETLTRDPDYFRAG